jgi:hypothetical protein
MDELEFIALLHGQKILHVLCKRREMYTTIPKLQRMQANDQAAYLITP